MALLRQRKFYHRIGPAREYRPTYAVASRTTSGPPRASNSAWPRSGRVVRHARSCQNPKTFGKVDRGKIAFSEWTFGLRLGYLYWLLRAPGFFTVNSTYVDQGFYQQTDRLQSRWFIFETESIPADRYPEVNFQTAKSLFVRQSDSK